MNKGIIETPKYYSVMVSLFFWAVVTVLCFYDVQESFLPSKISFFLNQPYHFSYFSTLIGVLSFVVFFVSVVSLFCMTDEFTHSLRVRTEEQCRLTSYKFVYLISQSVNIIGSVLIVLLSYLHYSIEKEWFSLSEDERIQLDETKFVDDKISFIKQLLLKPKQKNE
ncbi:hypothetical protein EDI_076580 [Entamoeba dispar SAW760]|uniref:Uncharacterized protein n=1 Tax=Entamoeba dispar (strain ATCC PRA-260 / SAW760) TaxID=370354 RepID=B0ET28_ENTDS|nr:uncharacterized protein EDI_076580 [Entamoeba dispar SAW760]EDR22320.1 hypothetical protein EDI_076580 [Entamoeba dispar SAW760]|eukprot:EDR22320.1 hypothetical protein EDI_076580 [Entamoeba dispar SAW760]